MKILVDQNLPLLASTLLRDLGHDSVHTRELGLQRATDQELLSLALEEDRIIVTLDIDFHTLLATSNGSRPSVILLRERGLLPVEVSERVQRVFSQFEERLQAGCLVTIGATSIRVRDLPLWRQS